MRRNKTKLKWVNDEAVCGFVRLSVGVEDINAKRVMVWWAAEPILADSTIEIGDGDALLKQEVLPSPDNSGDVDWMKIRAEKWLRAQALKMAERVKRD